MRIAYITLDEVNRFSMQQWAANGGLPVDCPAAGELSLPVDPADGIILDLDYLPAEIRTVWLARVLSSAHTGPVLVHGHNISDAESVALRRRGALVCRGQVCRRAVVAMIPAGSPAPRASGHPAHAAIELRPV